MIGPFNVSDITSLLTSGQFWGAVLAALLAFVYRSATTQQILLGLGNSFLAWLKRRMPESQWALARKYAEEAVTYAWQKGEAYGWPSAQRAQAATAHLEGLLKSHGVTRFDSPLLAGLVEAVWNEVKLHLHGVTPATTPEHVADPTTATLAGVSASPSAPPSTPPSAAGAPVSAPVSAADVLVPVGATATSPTSTPTA